MKKSVLYSLITLIFLFLFLNVSRDVNANIQSNIFLPIVKRDVVLSTGNIIVGYINAIGHNEGESDEYVEIINDDTESIQLHNWILRDTPDLTTPRAEEFLFPYYVIKPGEICRVYTNEYHPEWCGFSFQSPIEIWPNSAGSAYLWDSEGKFISWNRYIYDGLIP